MSKEKRRVPKLRFPGFTEDWEQRKLEDICSYQSSSLTINDIDENGQYDLYDANSLIGKTNKGYMKMEYITIIKDGAGVGRTRMLPKNSMFLGTMGALTPKNKCLGFLYQLVTNANLGKICTGSTIPHIYFKDYGKLKFCIPSIIEQEVIGKFFNNIDYLITLHQCKLEHLNLKKKALLQKLFPKNGECYPELRFPGFTDAWEQRKLSDISTKVTTKNVDVHYTETLTNSAEQGIISQVDFFDKEISNKDNINGYYIVENNDFIYNPRISTLAPVGPINRNKLNRTGIMSPLYTVFRASKVDLGFLEWYFQSNHWHRYMKLNGDSGARADRIAIKDSTFFEMPIKTPVNIKEQVLIGEILEKFNQYITLHQRKLEHLQLQKKALLQQMFV